MASKRDNLPLDIDKENESSISYANEVIAIIAGVAASEVEGIADMVTSGGLSDRLGKNRNITKGIRVEVGSEEVSVDIYLVMEYGTPIQKAANDVQVNVKKSIEMMTGLHVLKVDVHVQGVSFEKENEETTPNIEEPRSKDKTKVEKDKNKTALKQETQAEAEWETDKDDEAVENNNNFENIEETVKE